MHRIALFIASQYLIPFPLQLAALDPFHFNVPPGGRDWSHPISGTDLLCFGFSVLVSIHAMRALFLISVRRPSRVTGNLFQAMYCRTVWIDNRVTIATSEGVSKAFSSFPGFMFTLLSFCLFANPWVHPCKLSVKIASVPVTVVFCLTWYYSGLYWVVPRMM